MNAIIGMAELLLRSGLSDEARGYAQDIKQAGNNLISIINDILDFTKIEAGKMEIIPSKYLLASLINDTVNIIRTRLREKPIRFYTNIDGSIPHCLIGDEMRMRQILLNLLSNAAKFTTKGHISLSITAQQYKENKVWLNFLIADTGKGIKPEDQKKLFSEFVQVDSKRNRNVEGTGLGLTITKRLCSIMDGSISVTSEYGKGSIFTVTVPQGIASEETFAVVDDALNKKVLIYEGRIIYARSVCWSLENLGVSCTIVTTIADFAEALFKEKWSLILSGYGLHDKIKQIMNKPKEAFPGGEKPPLALMVEWGTEAYIPNVRFVSLPVQSLSIANILNGKADIKGYSDASSASGIIRYSFPGARILVVDDISTNLKVAEGLLAPYRATVDTCLSGAEAIELVKHYKYDIVFMDHMMPDMDGIEATAIIREWEKEKSLQKNENDQSEFSRISVVALTANAVSGIREMFLEKGFDDFIAKPIDVSKLDEVINSWISKDKRQHAFVKIEQDQRFGNFPKINGIDIQRGISMTGGTEAGFLSVLSIFRKDAQERLKVLRKSLEEEGQTFVINIHALKSASAAIGAQEVSEEAARLENASRAGDTAYIHVNLNLFIEQLSKLLEGISYALEIEKTENESAQVSASVCHDDKTEVVLLLKKLKEALKTQKAETIDILLNNLNRLVLDEETREAVDKISDDILMTEFDRAAKTIKEIMTNLKK
jgi:CheY-like chemotaxis protein/HPt (histidine-containing phosphotransfer) domain-containing protein